MKRPVEIAGLETLDREGLLALWAEVVRTPVPKKLSQPFLRRILAFELQARRRGGLGAGFLKRLEAAAHEGANAGNRSGARPAARRLAPGARLLRDWNGVTHVIEVTEAGFLWQGATWRSLSLIARTITGAHWSGPRFFGLTEPSATSDSVSAKRRAGQPTRQSRAAA